MLCRVFTVLSVLSLALCAAMLVIWVTSHTSPPLIRSWGSRVELMSSRGSLDLNIEDRALAISQMLEMPEVVDPYRGTFQSDEAFTTAWHHAGFSYREIAYDRHTFWRSIGMQDWFLALIFAILPLMSLRRMISRRTLRGNRCRQCAYEPHRQRLGRLPRMRDGAGDPIVEPT